MVFLECVYFMIDLYKVSLNSLFYKVTKKVIQLILIILVGTDTVEPVCGI